MVRKIVQKEFDSKQSNRGVSDFCKAQKEERLRELDEEYSLNLKLLDQIVDMAFNQFINRTHQSKPGELRV